MRILHVINDLRVGGAERLLIDLAPRLQGIGFDITVQPLGAAADSYLEAQLRESGVTLLPPPQNAPSLRSPRHLLRLARQMPQFDVVHVQLFPAQLWVALASRLLPPAARRRVKIITTEQNTHNRRRTTLFRPIDWGMYRQFDEIVAITDATADALANWVPATRGRMRVIHNAVPLETFREAIPTSRLSLGIPEDVPLITCVGRLETQKDHATLLRALAFLPGVHLALVGGGNLQPALEAQCRELGIAERVYFLGRRADVVGILKTSDVYVQPSRWEGFGIAVVEAMAADIPVIVSDVPGMREVVGDAGLRCPSGDAHAFTQAIEKLIADPTLRAWLIAAGRVRCEDFGIDACVEAHAALYRG